MSLDTTTYSSALIRTRSQDVSEFCQDWSGGEDSFMRPTLIAPNQAQHLVNIIVRDNYEARTRQGADSIPTAQTKPIANVDSIYSLRYFDTPTYHQLLASASVGSTPKFLKYETGAWTDLSGSWAPAAADSRVAMAQLVNKVLITDGVGQGQSYDGATFTATGAAGNTNFPIGATILMSFTSRMFASGVPASPQTIWISNFLDFSAGNWNGTTRSFDIGDGDGDPIVALAPMQQNTFAVLKRNSVWLVQANPALDDGTNTIKTFAAKQTVADGIGCVGRDAWCNYGNDVLFMAQDGVRSVQRMEAAAGQWQLTSPISQPIQPYIARINQAAWDKICAIKYQEFAFFFVPLDNSTTNNYVLVYNGRLQRWMGVWTNWTARCVEVTRFSGAQRFVFGDTAGYVNQWKDNSSNTDDLTYFDNGIGYPTAVWIRSLQFGDMINTKTAYTTSIKFTAGDASLSLQLFYDGVLVKTWAGSSTPTGDILGVDVLPFLLASTSPVKVNKGCRGLKPFQECYIAIESQTGWWWLRSVEMTAMLNPLKESV